MRRDMDLIRLLLIKLEAISSSHRIVTFTPDDEEVAPEGYDADQIAYHLVLLNEAGFIDSGGIRGGQYASGEFSFRRLTWAGHEFLDTIRDPEIWKRTKGGVSNIGGWTIGLLKDIATAYAKQLAKERLGLDLG